MTRTRTVVGALLLLAAAGRASAADPGWVVRVCADKAYTVAHTVDVAVTDGEGKNKQAVVHWKTHSTQTVFPVAAPLAKAPTLRVECHGEPYDQQVYLCLLYGGKLTRVIMFQDKMDATVAQTETDTGCPCLPDK